MLTPAELAEVEAQDGVRLPDEYRAFLTEVGAGGPAPSSSSLVAPGRRSAVGGRRGWVWDDEADPWLLEPGGPFVETVSRPARQAATLRAAGYEPTGRSAEGHGHDNRLDDHRAAFGEDGDELRHLDRDRGTVRISDNGWGMTRRLVLVGPHAGELRHRDCVLDPPFEPALDAPGKQHGFGSWFLEWLERRERAVR
ncbi:SMI1/KNR4 family protein [Kitasatospora sp. NPDC089913]|uniref:SMI1/KNR4 family protein n=1 Tax=Kitasatospora sp. NPDC089913 TaxID=3364080 RepID=UPI0038177ED7